MITCDTQHTKCPRGKVIFGVAEETKTDSKITLLRLKKKKIKLGGKKMEKQTINVVVRHNLTATTDV